MKLTDITRLGDDGEPIRVFKETYQGIPVLVEEKPIELAQFPVNGEALQQSILLHPRYAHPKLEHQIIQVRGFRRGRTLDIILDEPLVIGDILYNVLSFKGVGADADRPLVVHPTMWYEKENWVARHRATICANRFWGGIKRGPAVAEYKDPVLPDYGIPFTPQLAINHIPKELSKYLSEIEGRRQHHNISQIVRVYTTNIRLNESRVLDNEELQKLINAQTFGPIDAALINAQLDLISKGRMLFFHGYIRDNRFVDGTFTDGENWLVDPLKKDNGVSNFLSDVLDSTLSLLPNKEEISDYLQLIKRKTGITIKWEYFFGGANKSPRDKAFTDRLLQRARTRAAKRKNK